MCGDELFVACAAPIILDPIVSACCCCCLGGFERVATLGSGAAAADDDVEEGCFPSFVASQGRGKPLLKDILHLCIEIQF